MRRNSALPFAWEDDDRHEGYFYNVVFEEDFGVFKKDEEIGRLYIDFEEGYMACENENYEINSIQNFKLTPL